MFKGILNFIKNVFKKEEVCDKCVTNCKDNTIYPIDDLSKKFLKKLKIKMKTKRAKHYILIKTPEQNPLVLFVLTNTMPNIWKLHGLNSESLLKINEIIPIDPNLKNISDEEKRQMFNCVICWLKENNKSLKSLLVYDKQLSIYGYELGYTQISCNKQPRTVIKWGKKYFDNKLIYQISKKTGQPTELALNLKLALDCKKAKYETTPLVLGYVLQIKK